MGSDRLERQPDALEERTFDVVVVGGGIFGACVAWDAALRGMDVALVERGDFGNATSANSYKIIHGGMRYLQHLDLPRVRGSSHERSAFLRIAPHLVEPVPILIPTYGKGTKGKAFLRAGLGAFDLLTADRNRGIDCPSRHIPSHEALGREAVEHFFPSLSDPSLTGGVLMWDGQMYSPPRLVLSIVRSAADEGAVVANYMEATGVLREEGRVTGVEARDRLGNGRTLSIRARYTVNTAGPWAADLFEEWTGRSFSAGKPTFSRDVGLVVRRTPTTGMGVACAARTADAESVVDRGSRHLFILPWRDRTMVGVWHGEYTGSPDHVVVTEDEIRGFLDEVNDALPELALEPDDVTMVNTGLIVFGSDAEGGSAHRFGHRSVFVDHGMEDGLEGILTLIGVRATMARGDAERVVDHLAERLPGDSPVCSTARTSVHGGDFKRFWELRNRIASRLPAGCDSSVAESLAHNYGRQAVSVLDVCDEEPDLFRTIGRSSVLTGEVVHAVRHEAAIHLEDVVLRRTDLGTAGFPGDDVLRSVADLMEREAGWGRPRTAEEIESVRRFFRRRGAVRRYEPGSETLLSA